MAAWLSPRWRRRFRVGVAHDAPPLGPRTRSSRRCPLSHPSLRRAAPLLALALLTLPAPAHAVRGTLFLNAFGPGTDLPAQPQPAKVFTQTVGEVGVNMASEPIFGFRLTGGIDTFLQPPAEGRFSLNAASVHYNFGFLVPVLSNVNLRYQHGSWHQLDNSGFIPKYNKVGLEISFGTPPTR